MRSKHIKWDDWEAFDLASKALAVVSKQKVGVRTAVGLQMLRTNPERLQDFMRWLFEKQNGLVELLTSNGRFTQDFIESVKRIPWAARLRTELIKWARDVVAPASMPMRALPRRRAEP